MIEPQHPDAVAPERQRRIPTIDGELQLYEWGDPAGDPLVLVHGYLDHGRGFDAFAPLLAERFRVIAFDARGHGRSSWADAYHWPEDIADIARVLRSLSRPAHLVGHSVGGTRAADCAVAYPELANKVVSIDGVGPPPEGVKALGWHDGPWDPVAEMQWHLDQRRKPEGGWGCLPSFEALAAKRMAQNPRLSRDWARYFLYHGAIETDEGWTWRADAFLRAGVGPFSPDWIARGWQHLRSPLLLLVGTEEDVYGPLPDFVLDERLQFVQNASRAKVDGAGHFVHMEKPAEAAARVLEFLTS